MNTENGTAGVIYDVAALDRVQSWVDQQQEVFINAEKSKKNKEWLIIGGITFVSAIVTLLIFKKIIK